MRYQLAGDLNVNSPIGLILPTYCEAQNIEDLITEIQNLRLDLSVLVIDDSSPDETAEIVRKLQKKHGNLLLYTRFKKLGLGTAITDGFKIYLSLKNPPQFIVTMDADYSHDPKAILQLVGQTERGCGIVVGSRYCQGGKTIGWSWTRKLVSRTANLVAKSVVGLELDDCTSGFRCYSTEFLRVAIGSLHCQTYEIQIETLRQAFSRGFNVAEVPITFVNRKRGKSKLTYTQVQGYTSYIFKTVVRN